MSADSEAGREEPKKRGAKSQYAEEMFERVRARVAEGMPVPTAIQAAGMCVSQFYAAVAEHQEWKVALQKARQERRVERLEDESCRRIFIGDPRPVFWKGERVGEIREPAIGMLIFMMKTLSPERYANTKAAAKRRAQLDGLEASRARVLVNAQRGVKIMQGHYRAYLQRCGVPIPPGDSEQSSVKSDQLPVNSEQLPVNSEQSSVNSEQSSVNSEQSSVATRRGDDAIGQGGNLDRDLAHDLDQSGSGPACGTPPCGEDSETGRRGDAESKAPPCTHGASGAEDTAAGRRGDKETRGSDPSAGENAEASQCRDYDPDYDSEPKLPPPYEPWWRPGMDVTVTMLEDEAYRLAIEGVLKPIFQQGTEVGERRVRSERLLQFLLISSAFKKYGRREVGPLQAEEEPGRPEFMAKLNAIYGQDEELHRKFTEVFERNNARRHAERLADLERKNRASKAPPCSKAPSCTHGAFGAEDTAGQKGNLTLDHDLDLVPSGPGKAPPYTHSASGGEDTAAGQKGILTHDLDLNHNLVLSSPASVSPASGKAPPCTHGASGAEDTETRRRGDAETKQRGSNQSTVISNQSSGEDAEGTGGSEQSSVSNEWDVLDFDQFSAAVAARTSAAPSKAPPCTHSASGGEDTAAGQKGILTHDLDLNHNLVLSSPASVSPASGKAPPCTHGASGAEDAETPRSATLRSCLKTPEYPESVGQSHAQMTDNEKIAKHVNPAAGGSNQSTVSSDQLSATHRLSAVAEHTVTGQRGNLTLDHDPSSVAEPLRRVDLNHDLDLVPSGPGKAPTSIHTASGVEDPETSRSPAGTAENQGSEPEHDAAWYSPSARAARITQSMIEHRLRRRRVEM